MAILKAKLFCQENLTFIKLCVTMVTRKLVNTPSKLEKTFDKTKRRDYYG